MKHLSILFLTAALLTGCTDETNPVGTDSPAGRAHASLPNGIVATQKATTSTVRLTVPLDVLIPAAASSCLTEDVRLQGPVAARIHTTVDGRGVMHQNAYFNWRDVVATGQTTGTTWYTTAAAELYTTMNQSPIGPPFAPDATGSPAVFHHTGAIRFHSDSDAPNLYVHHLVQNVVDAQGNVRVNTDLLEVLECR